MTRWPPLLLVWIVLLTAVGSARAADWDTFSAPDAPTRACFLDQGLTSADLEELAGGKPKSEGLRQRAKDALNACRCDALTPPYAGPLFDAMAQMDETVEMTSALEQVRAAGVGKIALFARSRNRLGENEAAVARLATAFPDLVILGAPKYFLLRRDLSPEFIDATIEGVQSKGYKFVGEILYTHGDKDHGEQTSSGERQVDPSAPGTARLLDMLAPYKVPVMTHWEVYEWERDWPRFHALYGAYPDQIFIGPHMLFASPAQAREVLSAHPNVWMTVSKKEKEQEALSDPVKAARLGEKMINSCGQLKNGWAKVLTDFSDRLMFATDAHKLSRWDEYAKPVALWRGILGQLPPDVAERIAFRNAERLYGVTVPTYPSSPHAR